MNTKIFINIPVADVAKSLAFYQALGFTHNADFSDDSGACVIISETIYVMIASHAKFSSFTPKAICDTTKTTEFLLNLSCESRQQVDELVARAVAAGGTTTGKPEDLGFMYSDDFSDLDGHQWGLFYMSGQPPKIKG